MLLVLDFCVSVVTFELPLNLLNTFDKVPMAADVTLLSNPLL